MWPVPRTLGEAVTVVSSAFCSKLTPIFRLCYNTQSSEKGIGGVRVGSVLRLLGIGWYVALCIIGGVLGGFWLDRWLESSPLFTLLGLGVGLAFAGIGMYRMLIAVLSEASGPDKEGKR